MTEKQKDRGRKKVIEEERPGERDRGRMMGKVYGEMRINNLVRAQCYS